MNVTLDSLNDFTLENFAAVSRNGAAVRITDRACGQIQERRAAFMRFIDTQPTPWVYNVTGRVEAGRDVMLSAQERLAKARRSISAGAVLCGEAMPERIVRGALFCRLANFIEGHAAVRTEVVLAVAAMLGNPLPLLPRLGHGTSGEMLLLCHLFGDLATAMPLREKEASALVNGAPVAAALLADSFLRAGPLVREVIDAVAEAIDVYRAPLDAYDPVLGSLWRNRYASLANALLSAATRTAGAPPRISQAPVSFRAAPRLLARTLRSFATLRAMAEGAIRAVTDNPVAIAEGEALRVLSNGGFFDADAPAIFDEFAGACADLIRLLEKLAARLADSADLSALPRPTHVRLRNLVSALAGYAEDAASQASRTPLPGTDGGGAPENDLISPVVQAWAKHIAVGDLLSAAVATLRAVSACVKGASELEPQGADASLRIRMVSVTTSPPELEMICT
jgi:histidine ammonia-lyase